MDLIKTIEENIKNLKFSIEFNVYDFNYRQQDLMLCKVKEFEDIFNQVKSENEVKHD